MLGKPYFPKPFAMHSRIFCFDFSFLSPTSATTMMAASSGGSSGYRQARDAEAQFSHTIQNQGRQIEQYVKDLQDHDVLSTIHALPFHREAVDAEILALDELKQRYTTELENIEAEIQSIDLPLPQAPSSSEEVKECVDNIVHACEDKALLEELLKRIPSLPLPLEMEYHDKMIREVQEMHTSLAKKVQSLKSSQAELSARLNVVSAGLHGATAANPVDDPENYSLQKRDNTLSQAVSMDHCGKTQALKHDLQAAQSVSLKNLEAPNDAQTSHKTQVRRLEGEIERLKAQNNTLNDRNNRLMAFGEKAFQDCREFSRKMSDTNFNRCVQELEQQFGQEFASVRAKSVTSFRTIQADTQSLVASGKRPVEDELGEIRASAKKRVRFAERTSTAEDEADIGMTHMRAFTHTEKTPMLGPVQDGVSVVQENTHTARSVQVYTFVHEKFGIEDESQDNRPGFPVATHESEADDDVDDTTSELAQDSDPEEDASRAFKLIDQALSLFILPSSWGQARRDLFEATLRERFGHHPSIESLSTALNTLSRGNRRTSNSSDRICLFAHGERTRGGLLLKGHHSVRNHCPMHKDKDTPGLCLIIKLASDNTHSWIVSERPWDKTEAARMRSELSAPHSKRSRT
jgi:hypothetical protein